MGPPAIGCVTAANVVAQQSATEKLKFIEKLSNNFCTDMGLAQWTGLFPIPPAREGSGAGGEGQEKKKPAHSRETFVEVTLSEAINTRLVVQKQRGNNSGGINKVQMCATPCGWRQFCSGIDQITRQIKQNERYE